VQAIEKFRGNLAGHLVIGASTIPALTSAALHRELQNQTPCIQITLKIATPAEIAEGVLTGAGSRTHRFPLERSAAGIHRMFSDELLLTVYAGHPWADRKQVEPGELAQNPLFCASAVPERGW